MTYYAGIDVSLEYSSVCVVDGAGKIIREQRIASEPEALIAWFRGLGFGLERIGLEAGPMSQWLYAAMRAAGLAVELLETRHVRDAFKAMPVKSDRNDARGIAQLMRLGWFRAGALQVAGGAGDARAVDGAQAGAIEAFGCADEPTRPIAWLRPKSRSHDTEPVRRADQGTGRGQRNPGGHCGGAPRGPRDPAARVHRLREAGAFDCTFGRTGAAVDVDARRRRDCGPHLCFGD